MRRAHYHVPSELVIVLGLVNAFLVVLWFSKDIAQ